MSNSPLVSVNMAAYNAGNYIAEAIESVLSQTYQNWELIIINDCSTDTTADEIAKFNDHRIKVFHNEQNEGIVYTRNRALHYSQGKYIAVLDADDVFFFDKLEKQIHFMESNSDFGLIGTNMLQIDKQGKPITILELNAPNNHFPFILLFNNFLLHSSVLMHRSLAIKFLYRPLVKDYSPCEDAQIYVDISRERKIWNLPEVLVKYRIHNNSISKTRQDKIDEYQKSIILDQLKKLHIQPNEREFQVHINSYKEKKGVLINDIKEITSWLNGLIASNNKYDVYSEDFEEFITRKWYNNIINNCELGLVILLHCLTTSFMYSQYISLNEKKHIIKTSLFAFFRYEKNKVI